MISGISSRSGSMYTRMAVVPGRIGGFERIENKGIENRETGKMSGFAPAVRGNSADSVTISAFKTTDDRDFINFLSKKLSSEVRSGAAEKDMYGVKSQIAAGVYDIDAYDIADRIIC